MSSATALLDTFQLFVEMQAFMAAARSAKEMAHKKRFTYIADTANRNILRHRHVFKQNLKITTAISVGTELYSA